MFLPFMWRLALALWLLGCWVPSCQAGQVSIDLSRVSHFNLAPSMEYLRDEGGQYVFDDIVGQAKAGQDWQRVSGNTLRFGYLKGVLWLRCDLITLPDEKKDAQFFIDFHKVIDLVQVKVFQDGTPVEVKNTLDGHFARSFFPINSNAFSVYLSAGKNYSFFFKIDSDNSVGGEVDLWKGVDYINAQKQVFYGFVIYFFCVILSVLYGLFAYAATRFEPFKYHSLYAISILGLQGSQYGYISRVFGLNSIFIKSLLVQVFLVLSAFFVAQMVMSFMARRQSNEWLFRTHKLMIFLFFSSIVVCYFLSYRISAVYIMMLIFIGFFIFFVYAVMTFKEALHESMCFVFALMVLSPSTFLQMFSRLGLIDMSFFSEYLLMISIGVEIIIISMVLFYWVRNLNYNYLQARYFHVETAFPNAASLKWVGQDLTAKGHPYLYARAWWSGLDNMEILMGVTYYQQFLMRLFETLQAEIRQCGFVYEGKLPNRQKVCLFAPEKDTVGAFLFAQDDHVLDKYQAMVLCVMQAVKKEFQYNMGVKALVVGVPSFPGQHIDQILQYSHTAMLYSYKQDGKLVFYHDGIDSLERQQLMLMNDFQAALSAGQFYLLWQPQFHAKTLQMVGMEVLARWDHPVWGAISPTVFIPLLESSLQIGVLTHWVIDQVFLVLKEIIRYFPEIDIAINLSVQDLLTTRLIECLDSKIALYPGLQRYLTLEVTESMMIRDGSAVLDTVIAVRERGFRFSIDDFGAGYTSLSHLELLPADELKIDKRFADSCEQFNSRAIVSSIIDMAKKLNMAVVVEGIEHQQQADLFVGLGVDRLQGWLYAKPMPLQAVIQHFSCSQRSES